MRCVERCRGRDRGVGCGVSGGYLAGIRTAFVRIPDEAGILRRCEMTVLSSLTGGFEVIGMNGALAGGRVALCQTSVLAQAGLGAFAGDRRGGRVRLSGHPDRGPDHQPSCRMDDEPRLLRYQKNAYDHRRQRTPRAWGRQGAIC